MSNHLKNEMSPYLQQHAENPVNWYPWCKEAFDRAKREDKPVFLSVGYSTCHWCHVMAHESFEDERTAEILNKHFISIKVDREERPDIDSVYMSVCQALTGSGGWPMSIFMTWDKKPFLAGTYFPPRKRYGMPGFCDVLQAVAGQWKHERETLMRSAEQIIAHLKGTESDQGSSQGENADDICESAVQMFFQSFDSIYGGFGAAPKFPTPHNLLFLMLYAKRADSTDVLKMVEKTLLQMRKGGIFDQIGYGFSRYSTDPYFLVPHFEKMLYDNALLITAYAACYQITQNGFYRETAEQTAQYVIREMTSPEGGFYSAQDADSEGTEGKYYTFKQTEIMEILGEVRGKRFCDVFDITADGNFEGTNIPNLLKSGDPDGDFGDEIRKLYHYRKGRFPLHLDDKILLSWNSMMIAALSVLYRVSGNEDYLAAAVKAQRFLENNLSEGLQLYTSWRNGKHTGHGFLDDYAFYTAALTELYHAALDRKYLDQAERFCMETVRRFADRRGGGFYLTEQDDTELFMNPQEFYDGAVPSGNSVMIYNLVRLYQLTGTQVYGEYADRQMHVMSGKTKDYPTGYSMFLFAKMLYDDPPEHIVIVIKDETDLDKVKKMLPLTASVLVVPESREYPFVNDSTTFYVCRNNICMPPVNDLADVIKPC